jgi:phosphoglycolate phosphatase
MIVFDLDGTLVDSARDIVAAMEHAWSAVVTGTEFPRDRFRIGPPLAETIASLAPALDQEGRSAMAAAFREHYDASDFSQTLPYSGIREAIAALAARGERLCIATNKRRIPTLAIVERWFPDRFERVACIDGVWPDDGTSPGAKTAMLGWLGRHAGPGLHSAVMVGDTLGDVAAARAVGVRSIAVTWGYEDASSLAAAGPDELVHDVRSLLAALDAARR